MFKRRTKVEIPETSNVPEEVLPRIERLESDVRELGSLGAARLGTLEGLQLDLLELEEKLKALTFAVAEGIERVDRSERRVKHTIRRARKELAEHGLEHGGLEAEYEELRELDGDGGPGEGMQPVRESVAEAPRFNPADIGIPGQWAPGEWEALGELLE